MADLIKHTLGRGREPSTSRASEGLQPRQSRSLGTTTSSWLRFYKCWCAIQRILTIQGLQLGLSTYATSNLTFSFQSSIRDQFQFSEVSLLNFYTFSWLLPLHPFHTLGEPWRRRNRINVGLGRAMNAQSIPHQFRFEFTWLIRSTPTY